MPEIADCLRILAIDLGCDELKDLADQIRRRPSQRAPIKSEPMTKELEKEIKKMKAENPNLHGQEIASKLNINPGRVSETLRGKRT